LEERQNRKLLVKAANQAALIINAPKVFITILDNLCQSFNFNTKEAIDEVITFHDNLIKNHTVKSGTDRYNMIRLYCIMLLEGQNPDPLTRVAVGNKDRWPSAFHKLRPLFYRVRDLKCPNSDRVIRSILYMNRLCNGNNYGDLTEIVRSFTVESGFINRFNDYVTKAVKKSELNLVTKPSTRVLSNGPNGKPKWLTADIEACALINSELNVYFKTLCKATGNMELYDYMVRLSESLDKVGRKARLRFLSAIPDKGNKCRIVAISDYWTQVLLEPIMLDVQSYIKERFSDVSYSNNHSQGFVNLKKFIRPGIVSYDITSWTDAFPSSLQHCFMKARFGNTIADAWYSLVVSCEWRTRHRDQSIKFNRGQGMGTNGSFDIATASDLFLLEMIYKQEYKMLPNKSTYNKVGDDLWCYDPDGHIYRTYTQICGMSININKTKTATEGNLCGEFVSRSINNGIDVSRISANICRSVKRNIIHLPQLVSHLSEREYNSILPLKSIFIDCSVHDRLHWNSLIRTFWVLCKLYPNRNLELLEKSLEESFKSEIDNDEVITILKLYGVGILSDSFNSYLIKSSMDDIINKGYKIVDSCSEYDSSKQLLEKTLPDNI
jgi:hypothetical protein